MQSRNNYNALRWFDVGLVLAVMEGPDVMLEDVGSESRYSRDENA